MKKILSLSAFLAIALLILAACQTDSTMNKATNNANKPAAQTNSPGHTDDAPRITLAEAKKDFDAGNVVFVDTRPKGAYDVEHVKGSINMTTGEADARYKELETGKKIIAYCS